MEHCSSTVFLSLSLAFTCLFLSFYTFFFWRALFFIIFFPPQFQGPYFFFKYIDPCNSFKESILSTFKESMLQRGISSYSWRPVPGSHYHSKYPYSFLVVPFTEYGGNFKNGEAQQNIYLALPSEVIAFQFSCSTRKRKWVLYTRNGMFKWKITLDRHSPRAVPTQRQPAYRPGRPTSFLVTIYLFKYTCK